MFADFGKLTVGRGQDASRPPIGLRPPVLNQKATLGGLSHGQGITALHMAQYGHMPVVRLLVDRSANRSIKDDLYQATAEGSASFFGQNEVRDYLKALGA